MERMGRLRMVEQNHYPVAGPVLLQMGENVAQRLAQLGRAPEVLLDELGVTVKRIDIAVCLIQPAAFPELIDTLCKALGGAPFVEVGDSLLT